MNRGSDTFVWSIRWETLERQGDTPLYGAPLPDSYPSLGEAQREQRRLQREQPMQPNPLTGGEARPVQYVLVARQPDDVPGR